MEAMELSLDDIIKTNKASSLSKTTKPYAVRKPSTFARPIQKRPVRDARMLIIKKKRAKIVDARDRLAELTRIKGDARDLIRRPRAKEQNGNGLPRLPVRALAIPSVRKRIGGGGGGGGGSIPRHATKAPPYRSRPLSELVGIPRGYIDYDNMERMEQEEFAAATRLSRTVKNDFSAYDDYPLPVTRSEPPRARNELWRGSGEHYDPFEVYHVPAGSTIRHERRMSPELLPPPPKSILRQSSRQVSMTEERYPSPPPQLRRDHIPEYSPNLSYEMRSRLEHAPDPHASMGIFANQRKPSPPRHHGSSSMSSSSSSANGYRIVVSNLHTTVTQGDVRELFEDIGPLYDARLVRPGVAEVVYKSLTDAETAVDTYHNRQLDGQPMKCLLVNPRASDKPTAPALRSNSRLNPRKTPLEIDIDALHKVLFRR